MRLDCIFKFGNILCVSTNEVFDVTSVAACFQNYGATGCYYRYVR